MKYMGDFFLPNVSTCDLVLLPFSYCPFLSVNFDACGFIYNSVIGFIYNSVIVRPACRRSGPGAVGAHCCVVRVVCRVPMTTCCP